MASNTSYEITAEQRAALLSPQICSDYAELNETLKSIKQTFDKEGFVLIRGLIDDDTKASLIAAGTELQKGARPPIGNLFNALEFGTAFNCENVIYRQVALESAIPVIIAKLMLNIDEESAQDNNEENKGDETSPTTLRLLKDAFMAKGKEEKHCGWHVDDSVFWPTDSSSSGVNVWLSLDEIPAKYGGGMAVSPRSHTAVWRRDAYACIGSTPTLRPEGLSPAELLKSFGNSCNMAALDENLYNKIESTKIEFDYQPGDCLFCNRWLFHRSTIINEDGLKHYGGEESALKRYTIRYERGSARLLNGTNLEPSVLMDSQFSGKTLDEVCEMSSFPYYPKCWPPLQVDEMKEQTEGMERLAKDVLSLAMKKKIEVIQGLFAKPGKA